MLLASLAELKADLAPLSPVLQQSQAHEQPVIFFSVALGLVGKFGDPPGGRSEAGGGGRYLIPLRWAMVGLGGWTVELIGLLACVLGPLAVVVVPEVRKSFGWKPVSRPPTTYPRKSDHDQGRRATHHSC